MTTNLIHKKQKYKCRIEIPQESIVYPMKHDAEPNARKPKVGFTFP